MKDAGEELGPRCRCLVTPVVISGTRPAQTHYRGALVGNLTSNVFEPSSGRCQVNNRICLSWHVVVADESAKEAAK